MDINKFLTEVASFGLVDDTDENILVEEENERKRLEEERERLEEESKKESEVLQEIQENENVESKGSGFTSFLQEVSEFEDKGLEDISIQRRMAFGAAQEPYIVGSAARLGEAFFTSLFTDESYTEAARRIEKDRQAKIFQEYPEFLGKEEDMAVLSGRMGIAISDPVTFFIPWAKFGKGSKLIAASAGVAAGDAALREYALTGEVSPTVVAASAGLGGASGAVGNFIANRINLNNNSYKINLKNSDGSVDSRTLTSSTSQAIPKLSNKQADEFEKLSLELFEENAPQIKNITKNYSSIGEMFTKIDLIKKDTSILRNTIRKYLVEVDKVTKRDLVYSKKTKTKKAKVFKASKDLTRVEAEKILEKIKSNTKLQKQINQDLHKLQYNDIPEDTAIVGAVSLYRAWDKGLIPKGEAGEQIVRAFVYEAVRPLFGATAGGLVGIYASGEGENEDYLTEGIMLGAAAGIFSRVIDTSKFKLLPKNIVETAKGEFRTIFRTNYLNFARSVLAGTQAAALQTRNKILQKFGLDLYRNLGANLKTGQTLQASVEGNLDIANDFFRKKLGDIFAGQDDETILAVGRLVQQRNMKKNSKFSFLEKGDLSNKVANKLAREVHKLDESFKSYMRKAGVEFDEADAYGLTQILDPNAANTINYSQSVDLLRDAFILQSKNNKGKIVKGFSKIDKNGNYIPIKVLSKNEATALAKKYLDGADGVRRQALVDVDSLTKGSDDMSIFIRTGGATPKNHTVVQSAKFFENERVLFDQEARALAKKLFVQDPIATHISLFENSTRVAEFARRFGSKGQGILKIRKALQAYYSKIAKSTSKKSDGTPDLDADFMTNDILRKNYQRDIADLRKSINHYFQVQDPSMMSGFGNNDLLRSIVLTVQTLLATTKLTKVAIPSLGDMIQTMQNSGYKAAFRALAERKKVEGKIFKKSRFARDILGQRVGEENVGTVEGLLGRTFQKRRYDGDLNRELQQFSILPTAGVGGHASYQQGLIEFQRKFFEAIQLGRVTRNAREFAFDAGIFRAYDLGKIANKTGKLSRSQQREIDYFGLTAKEMSFLGRFKNIDEAYSNKLGEKLLNQAGRRSADRDALIPQLGNRRLFSQAENPLMRFAGSFLSWAQAKVSQTSALIRRVQEGDGRLALLMLSTLPIYAAVRDLYATVNPNKEFREDSASLLNAISEKDLKELAKATSEGAVFSGQTMPWYIDKIVNASKYGVDDPIEIVYPAAGLVADLFEVGKTSFEVVTDASQADTLQEGFEKLYSPKLLVEGTEALIPFGKDVVGSGPIGTTLTTGLKELGIVEDADITLKQLAEEKEAELGRGAIALSKGGLVSSRKKFTKGGKNLPEGPEVLNTKEIPADRVNPITGEPYSGKSELELQMENLIK